jgi:hypothetical protein
LPILKEILPAESKPGTPMITSEKLEEFLNVINNTPEAKVIARPKILASDAQPGVVDGKDIKLNVKNTVGADRKTVMSEIAFEYTCSDPENQASTSVASTVSLLSGHATALSGLYSGGKAAVLMLVKVEVLEAQSASTGVVAPELKTEKQESEKEAIEITARFLLRPIGADRIAKLLETKSFQDVLIDISSDPNQNTYLLNGEQVEGLLTVVNADPNLKPVSAAKIIVNAGEDATSRIYRTIKYPAVSADSNEPEMKELQVSTLFKVRPTLDESGERIFLEYEIEHTKLLGFTEAGLPETKTTVVKSKASMPDNSVIIIDSERIIADKDGQEQSLLVLIRAKKVEPDKTPVGK